MNAFDAPQQATETPPLKGTRGWCYRLCRKGTETPCTLRPTVDLTGLSFAEKRALLISACATGNEQPSPFLHTTSSLSRSMLMFGERRRLYSNWLVRWPLGEASLKDVEIDFTLQSSKIWLNDENGDTDLMMDHLQFCRRFVEKDSEVVFMARPASDLVEWWDCVKRKWTSLKEKPSATSQMLKTMEEIGQTEDSGSNVE